MIDIHATFNPTIEAAATRACSRYPNYIDVDDVVQAVWVEVLSKQNSLQEMLRAGKRNKVTSIVRKMAETAALKEDAVISGYDPSDQYTYPFELVRELLSLVYDYNNWSMAGNGLSDTPRGRRDPAHGNDKVAMLSDVKAALKVIPDEQAELLFYHYGMNWTYEMIGAEWGIGEEAARQRTRRAVGAVQRALGRKPSSELQKPTQSRTGHLSIRQAQAQLEQDYDG